MSTSWFFTWINRIKTLVKQGDFSFYKVMKSTKVWVFLPILPFSLFFGSFILKKKETASLIAEEVQKLEKKRAGFLQNRAALDHCIYTFQASDPLFLQEVVSLERPLTEDKAFLKEIAEAEGSSLYEPILKRIQFLESDQNRLEFVLKEERKKGVFQETVWGLKHPVEMSLVDVKKTLSLLEGNDKRRPDLSIQKLDLVVKDKKSLHKEFSFDVELVQRGFHEEL